MTKLLYPIVVGVSVVLGTALSMSVQQPVPDHGTKPASSQGTITMVQPIKMDAQPLPTLEPIKPPSDGIPANVYCGSPAQRNTKHISVANAAIGRQLASERGWTGKQWTDLLELWSCESSWNATSWNTEDSGSYGIPQALPASKMKSKGADYLTNPTTQIQWGLDYIADRYGSPSVALAHHYSNNWY